MKKYFVIIGLLSLTAAPFAQAQRDPSAPARHRKTKVSASSQSHHSSVPTTTTRKTGSGSVDEQLKKLEHDTGNIATGKSAKQAARPNVAPLKPNSARDRNKAIQFKYQEKRGGGSSTSSQQRSGRSGVRRGVSR